MIVLLSIAAAYWLTAFGLHPALAFLIVAVFYLLIAVVLVLIGRRKLQSAKGPQRAIETSKESVEALKAIGKGDQEPALESRPEPGVPR